MEIKKSYYAIIPAAVRYDNDLTPNAKLLYGELTALANEKGYCWASNSYFAELYGKTNNTISRWIQILRKKGYISVELKYVEGTKQVETRKISIINGSIKPADNAVKKKNKNDDTPIIKNDDTPTQKEREGTHKNDDSPTPKKVEDNTTIINNTINKKKYKDCVLLSDQEYQNLIIKLGELKTEEAIESLNNYMMSTGNTKKYKSHYHTILSWNNKNKNTTFTRYGIKSKLEEPDWLNKKIEKKPPSVEKEEEIKKMLEKW